MNYLYRTRWIILLAVLAATIVIIFRNQPEASILPQGANYFVDAVSGDDTNDGLSENSPWRSLQKVDDLKFNPGDTILFKRGGEWHGNLIINYSGTESQPITFGSYGEGDRPIFNGAERVSNWQATGTSNVYKIDYNRRQAIVVIDNEQQESICAYMEENDLSCLSKLEPGKFFLETEKQTSQSTPQVSALYIYSNSDPNQREVEISDPDPKVIPSGNCILVLEQRYVTIEDVKCQYYWGSAFRLEGASHNIVRNSVAYRNRVHGFVANIRDSNLVPSEYNLFEGNEAEKNGTGLYARISGHNTFRDNRVNGAIKYESDIGGNTDGSGIGIQQNQGSVFTGNDISHVDASGIEGWRSGDVVVAGNFVHENTANGIVFADIPSVRSEWLGYSGKIQIHQNIVVNNGKKPGKAGIVLLGLYPDNSTCVDNTVCSPRDAEIFNNLIYNDGAIKRSGLILDKNDFVDQSDTQTKTKTQVKNNLVWIAKGGGAIFWLNNHGLDAPSRDMPTLITKLSNLTNSHNGYFGAGGCGFSEEKSGEPGAICGVNPKIDELFRPLAESPLIDAGTKTGISLTQDYAGNQIGELIDIGAYEFQGKPLPKSKPDEDDPVTTTAQGQVSSSDLKINPPVLASASTSEANDVREAESQLKTPTTSTMKESTPINRLVSTGSSSVVIALLTILGAILASVFFVRVRR